MRGRLLFALGALATVLVAGRGVAELVAERAWYQAMGVPSLFWEALTSQLLLQGGAWGLGSLFAFLNLHAVRRTVLAVAVPVRVGNLEVTTLLPSRRLTMITVVLALLIGGVLATPLTDWSTVTLIRHGLPFGELEGITGRDLGFYVYWLPLEETLYLWALLSVVTSTTVVLLLYALTRSLRIEGRRVTVSVHVRRHLSVLAALVLLLLAWSHRLDAFDVLQQGSGPDGLVLRVDHAITLPMDRLLVVLAVVAALVVLRTGWTGQLRSAVLTLGAVLVAAIGFRHGVPFLAAQGSWLGDPSRRESDYVAARALFSRRAFRVDAIQSVTDSQPASARAAWRQLTVWDTPSLLGVLPPAESSGDHREGRSPASAGGVAGWAADGVLIDLLVGRPVAAADGNWSWWRVAGAGRTDDPVELPEARREDGGRSPLTVAPGVSRPLVLPRDQIGAVPAVPLASWRDRVLHAWALREPALLRAVEAGDAAALVLHRDVRSRVQRLAPIFVQGSVVTPLWVDHRLFWIVHLYSASDRYPISQRWTVAGGTYGYFQLAATAVLEAATGRVTLRPVAAPDPLARTWMQQAPALFVGGTWVPQALEALLPVPNDQMLVQMRTFARYGARFDGAAPRLLADSVWTGGPPDTHLLEDHGQVVPGWAVPIVDAGGLVVGVMRAMGGGAPRLQWEPLRGASPRWDALRAGTAALEDSLRGTAPEGLRSAAVLVTRPSLIDRDRQLLVVRTARAISRTGRIEGTRVGVSDGVRSGIGRTLEEAADRAQLIVPGGRAIRTAAVAEDPLDRAARWYARMREALRQGDWPAFGAAFDSLGRDLRRSPR